MSEKFESMAVVAEAMRDLSDAELDQVFGGDFGPPCSPAAEYCEVYCCGFGCSYMLCFAGGVQLCGVGPVADANYHGVFC